MLTPAGEVLASARGPEARRCSGHPGGRAVAFDRHWERLKKGLFYQADVKVLIARNGMVTPMWRWLGMWGMAVS